MAPEGLGFDEDTVSDTLYEVGEDGPPSTWSLYLKETVIWDEKLAEHWKAQIDSILIFTGLFSATVAAFIIESYKTLQPDSGDTTVALLNYLSQVSSIANGTQPPPPPSVPTGNSFQAPSTMVHVNVLWFLSLTFSLASAVGAIMMQQCARFYQTEQFRQQRAVRGNPQSQARVHAYLLNGLERWLMIEALNFLPTHLLPYHRRPPLHAPILRHWQTSPRGPFHVVRKVDQTSSRPALGESLVTQVRRPFHLPKDPRDGASRQWRLSSLRRDHSFFPALQPRGQAKGNGALSPHHKRLLQRQPYPPRGPRTSPQPNQTHT
ncbi:hypothetical protein OF83DRAFT_713702 [Amylostereum chailletii]|nr:hypothetical protein OF83DRAFT_713702 [Amylostereum chailletii]